MILAGSALLWLGPAHLLGLTAVLLVGTELLTPESTAWQRSFPLVQRLLLVPGGDARIWVNYPVLPWMELVTFGMAFGHWLAKDAPRAFDRAIQLGVACTAAFVAVRSVDGFGNIRPRAGSTWIDFLNVVKYPPSIGFSLLTMGVNLTIMGLMGKVRGLAEASAGLLGVLGRVPLFFYVAHLFMYAGLGWWLKPGGAGIVQMYPYWVLGLVVLYPVCWGYGWLKRRHPGNPILSLA